MGVKTAHFQNGPVSKCSSIKMFNLKKALLADKDGAKTAHFQNGPVSKCFSIKMAQFQTGPRAKTAHMKNGPLLCS